MEEEDIELEEFPQLEGGDAPIEEKEEVKIDTIEEPPDQATQHDLEIECAKLMAIRNALAIVAVAVVGVTGIVAVILLAAIALPLATFEGEKAKAGQIPFSFIEDGSFTPKFFTCQWIENGQSFVYVENVPNEEKLVLRKTVDNPQLSQKVAVFPSINENDPSETEFVEMSPDGKYVLFSRRLTTTWRHSAESEYVILDVLSFQIYNLVEGEAGSKAVSWAKWGPDSSKILYCLQGDLFVKTISFDQENNTFQITNDAQGGNVLNGRSSWEYEEEILGTDIAAWFSPSSRYIAYIKFNISSVHLYSLPHYDVHQPGGNRYPYETFIDYRYPAPSFNNSDVSLVVVDLDKVLLGNTETSQKLIASVSGNEGYIPFVRWVTNEIVSYKTLDRKQQSEVLFLADIQKDSSNIAYANLITDSSAWIDENYDDLIFLDQERLIIHRKIDDDKISYQVSSFSEDLNGSPVLVFPSCGGDSMALAGFQRDVNGGAISVFYVAAIPTPLDRSVVVVSINKNLEGWRATGPQILSLSDGTESSYTSIDLSPSGQWAIWNRMGSDIPISWLVELQIDNTNHWMATTKSILEDNHSVKESLKKIRLPSIQYQTIPSHDGVNLNGYVLFPPDFATGEKLPLLVYAYGGPRSQTVSSKHLLLLTNKWHLYLASVLRVIVVSVDNRGTCCRGNKFLSSVYKKLGVEETKDQMAVIDYFSKKSYVDHDRIGFWGWSYGGYMSARMATAKNNKLAFAISVAPVSSWEFYDSVYTERYMLTPSMNQEGYSVSSVLPRVHALANEKTKFFMVHGLGDDNVHFLNSARLVSELVDNGILFNSFYYPDEAHSLSYRTVRWHLWNMLTEFVSQQIRMSWTPVPPPISEAHVHSQKKKRKRSERDSLF